jgi:hypothetical protein
LSQHDETPGCNDAALRPIKRDGGDGGFREPWEVQVLAVVNGLIAGENITAAEWSEILGQEIRLAQGAGDLGDGSTYYLHVLAALERLTREKGMASSSELLSRKQAWTEAYERTPHGQPVTL